ncbi:cyclic beta-1,2-glucan synthetase [Methylophilaceae bacterium]|nr:cyclic beta-1,2-glucan synthetase [Methylophilaceae bacterium]
MLKKSNSLLSYQDDEPPLRSELFSAAQMQHHGQVLAGLHKVHPDQTPDRLLPRLADNENALVTACATLTDAVKENRQIMPAAEWLLDNFYLIEEQIRTAKQHLPKGYSKELPRLMKGPSAGRPRVYDIALETIAHGDGRVDPESLSQFVAAYQQITVLKLGELWAIPIMLRLALIENLRRVAVRIATSRLHCDAADTWADQMIEAAEKDPNTLILLVADMARSDPLLDGSFVAKLVRRLRGQSPALTLPLTWLTQRLAESGTTIEQLIQTEAQLQAAEQVSISNSICSLRALATIDWRDFVESMSHVEQALRRDHASIYGKMDFATRDRYRHVIESLAKKCLLTESEVAEHALALSAAAASAHGQPDEKTAHIGFYLVGNGLPALEKSIQAQHRFIDWPARKFRQSPLGLYLGSIASLTLIISAMLLETSYDQGLHGAMLVLTGLIAVLASSQLALALVNWLVTLLMTPQPLPRMDFSKGIPVSARTLVVVPTMLLNAQNIAELCESLEVHFLANRDANLRFCLLTDLADAHSETLPADEMLLQQAERRITQLNETYAGTGTTAMTGPFLLLHRPRRWNAQEQIWMGHERKRGKLSDLNAYLRRTQPDDQQALFTRIVGDTQALSGIQFVITLDTDTQLPRDAARLLIATIAHPLNRARYDETRQRVCEGYGILQPRVVASLPSRDASLFERLCGGEAGIDPYTRTVSDVYQDLFHEGAFIGKGIYDIDAFEQAMRGRFPENRILSHDLLEGCYARAGLVSDIQLHEEYPRRYSADVSRRHRWIRGDWQLLSWLLPKVPAAIPGTAPLTNPLSTLSRWKILDNLRRSLVSPALTLLLLMGWIVLPSPWLWSAAVLSILFIPSLAASILDMLRKPSEVLIRQHVVATVRSTRRHLAEALLNLAFTPYEAFYSMHAILQTLWRQWVTRKGLLEWNPSSGSKCETGTGLSASLRAMWFVPMLAVAVTLALVVFRPGALAVALPFLLLWYVSPGIAWWISRPQPARRTELHADQTLFLHRLARKTWAFFETYVGPDDNWLPPDNMQQHPVAVVAHRTSPTNIGLALLANLTAYDFGYIPTGQLLRRTGNTLRTMGAMERHQGHFYNWYDTQTLMPLHPMYISSVDSGNLAGYLLTLRAGLLMLPEQPILSPRLFSSIDETFLVLAELLESHAAQFLTAEDDTLSRADDFRKLLQTARVSPPVTLTATLQTLDILTLSAQELAHNLAGSSNENEVEAEAQLAWWAEALARQCRDTQQDLLHLAPWLVLPGLAEISAHFPELDLIPDLRSLARLNADAGQRIEHIDASGSMPSLAPGTLARLHGMIAEGSQRAVDRILDINRLALQAAEFARMEYGFLYNEATHLLAIGYNVSEYRLDAGCYDLLASEARLCSFVAIAQGQLPQEAWFALGRQLTIAGGEPILLSWSGSMFEYLMPLLIMPNYENTLLDQTCKSVVTRQIEYGLQRTVPWGVSESGYHAFDSSLNYQYRAFGVPGLGLKRGLGDDLVIAPYATMLALMVAPEEACTNLQRLSIEGAEGRFGMHEAIDFTPSRIPRGQSHVLIRSYMAHHQGMSLLSLSSMLLDRPMQRRFESDPLFQATLLLLKERIPKATASYSNTSELSDIRSAEDGQEMPMRVITRVDTRIPEVQLLSNGRYNVMMTNAGGSYSRWRDLAVTRWREDSTCDQWGTFCYVRNVTDGSFWSTSYQPTQKPSQDFEVIFSEGRAEFRRHDNGFDMHTEIVVSPEDDIELRRTRITNRSRISRTIDVTSYAEVVLAPAAADAIHPAFSNLFVQTEYLPGQCAILCTRRPRSEHEVVPLMFHLLAVHGTRSEEVSFETDRMAFIGRGNTVKSPLAMTRATLSGSQGSVLDPIVAIRHKITIAPEQSIIIDMVTGIAESRDSALGLINKYQDLHLADRVFELAWTHSHVVLRQLNASETDAQLYGRLANSIIYSNALLRADASILTMNHRGQSGLWSYAISGDLPIVLLQISSAKNIELVRQLVQAHAYWRMKGLAVDLVIWNEDHAGYRQGLQDQIMGLVASGIEPHAMERPGGIFVRLADQIPNDDRILLQSVARAIVSDSRGTLAEQINRRGPIEVRVPQLVPSRQATSQPAAASLQPQDLLLFNGLGGFTPDGREYVITTNEASRTPAPWVNVIANAHFGSVISESGQAYTWGENAHEFRLTPWSNDPVSDGGGEAFYLRDEETGHFWSPTPLPCRGTGDYVTRHGFGYSVFEHIEDGIHSALTVYVALDASIKFSVLKVRNDSGRARRLSATGYVEWVLGDLRQKSAMHIVTEADPLTGALFARNAYNADFPDHTAFFYVDAIAHNTGNISISGDRTEFIGRNGNLQKPAAMLRARLSGKLGAGLDPCAAIQIPFDLADGEQRETVFMLGVAGRRSVDVSSLVQRFKGTAAAREALAAVTGHWTHTLGAVQIETPDVSLNILTNGWLLYQTIACRLWARSGFYQSGGAFGFRDQLQDVMALIYAQPHMAREHLLLCAAHQFVEGDAQHWWHPPSNRGVRTHCSDDYLWLALATSRYVLGSGDSGVLDETIVFLSGRQVNPEEDSYYDLPACSNESATLYEHCKRAIMRGFNFGVHGLPLIGSCDWNDGMDKVGSEGKGESVWLGFFLYEVLMRFTPVARLRGDLAFVERCQQEAVKLQANIEKHGWDGNWYRRAYFDDGTPLGSAGNEECQIDSISQSWSVLSGAGDPERSRAGMEAVDRRLVRREHGLVQLLDPPFDKSDRNPGYIKGYVPGVRENGGQYTHAAIWAAMAFAKLGDNARAWELLDMINPLNHGRTPEAIAIYKVEPYVIAADIYAVSPHIGRGGWTWYTGSSGWMYRLIIESLLGLTLENETLHFAPCLPADWHQFKLRYRHLDTFYQITVMQRQANRDYLTVSVDGIKQDGSCLSLVNDRGEHVVDVAIGLPGPMDDDAESAYQY